MSVSALTDRHAQVLADQICAALRALGMLRVFPRWWDQYATHADAVARRGSR